MTEYRLSVRELAEFCHRKGDIDYRFSPSPTAQEGVAGHQRLQRRRGYEAEYPLEAVFETGSFILRLAGRADGYQAEGPLLEEIKTCRVPRDDIPCVVEGLHWAQLMIYGGLLCSTRPELDAVALQLTYLNVDTDEESSRQEQLDRNTLLNFLADSVTGMSEWLGMQHHWLKRRDASLASLAFPYPAYRAGQREMAETAYKCIARSGQVLLEAPTGIGKTAAVLFPALKALAVGKHDRVCYVTARTVGRLAVEQTLQHFASKGMLLRRLSVSAKEAICLSPGSACHGEDCAFARGYYDRLPAALAEAVEETALDRDAIQRIARSHTVCPYQLGMDLLPWVDLCIGDIHYVYSFHACIGSLYDERRLRWSVLLDEVHNLPERARKMYSAQLEKAQLMRARRVASGSVRKALDRCNRALLSLKREVWLEPDFDSRDTPPANLVKALAGFVGAVHEQQAVTPLSLQRTPELMDFYFATLQFQRVLEIVDRDFRFEMYRDGGPQDMRVLLRCLDPSRVLSGRQRRPNAVVAFSATASPARWMLEEIGFAGDAVFNSLDSPFSAEQLRVVLDTSLDTRYRARQASLGGLADVLEQWLAQNAGNCIVYFSAYHYMEAALDSLGEKLSGRHVCVQSRSWRENDRADLLKNLRERTDVAAFCILGGVFGEGIDLPGEALKSVVVVGVGLPQVSREREVLKDYYQAKHGRGFQYAYQYPGMQKVSQAVGRVVRREADDGSALLIDQRYGLGDYRALLPPWWSYPGQR
jgi:DNA excision repair protein ERCC-2